MFLWTIFSFFPSPGEGVWLHLRLDQWLTTMLLRIKKSIQGDGGDGDLKWGTVSLRMPPSPCSFCVRASDHCGCPFNGFISLHMSLTMCVCVCLSRRAGVTVLWAGGPPYATAVWRAASRLSESPEFSKNCSRILLLGISVCAELVFHFATFLCPFPGLGTQPSCCNRCFGMFSVNLHFGGF